MMNTIARIARWSVPAAAAGLLCACSTPGPNMALESARQVYRSAADDPQVVGSAPVELQSSQDSLRRAENALASGADKAEVDHLAYLAGQRARIALERGQLAVTEEQIRNARAEREQAVRQARERELQTTQQTVQQQQQQLAHERARAQTAEQVAAQQAQRAQQMQNELQQLHARQTPLGMVMTLGDVLFDVGKSTLKPGAQRTLDRLAHFLKNYPERKLRIEGYTDDTGSAEINQALSRARAEAVRDQLMQRDIAPERVEAVGYGDSFPVASNRTAAGRQQNRRVEVVISDTAGNFVDRSSRPNQRGGS